MDALAAESHRRAHESWESGHFAAETLPVPIRTPEGVDTDAILDRDEGIRPESTVETLAALGPAAKWDPDLAPDITPGNSSQMSDGASAMLVADRATAEALGLPVRARFVSFAVGADDAVLVLSAPNPVTRKLLARTGMTVDQFDSIECNEAFAAIALRWARRVPARRRPQPAQPPGRRHRRRPSPGSVGGAPGHDPARRPRGHRRPVRLHDHVRGRRPGQRHRDRAAGLIGPNRARRGLVGP